MVRRAKAAFCSAAIEMRDLGELDRFNVEVFVPRTRKILGYPLTV